MAMAALAQILFTIFAALSICSSTGSYAVKFIVIINECSYPIWPAIGGSTLLPSTTTTTTIGFGLLPGDSYTVPMPPSWTGHLWARTLCTVNITGNFSCVTGDCGSSNIDCGGGNANPKPPVTLAEFTLNSSNGLDYVRVSRSHGFNLPMSVKPRGGTGDPRCQAYESGSFTCASVQNYTLTFCHTSSKGSKKSGKKKKHQAEVDNLGGYHVGVEPSPPLSPVASSSHYVLYISSISIVSLIFSFLYCFRPCACKTRYRSLNRELETSVSVGQQTSAGTRPNSQPSDVEMGDLLING